MNVSYKSKNKGIFLVLFAIIFQLLLVGNVHASDVDAVVSITKNAGEVSSICNSSNALLMGKKVLSYNSAEGTLTFSNSNYSELDFNQRRLFMERALLSTKESHLGTQVKNKMYNFIAEQDSSVSAAMKFLKSDTSADFAEAKAWFLPFSSPISIVLGVLCLTIFVFMGASMVFDAGYMVLPGMQGILERGDPNKRPFGVSNEAWKATKKAEESDSDIGVMGLYVKMRLPVILIVSLCLGYLITGKIYDILVYFIDAFS